MLDLATQSSRLFSETQYVHRMKQKVNFNMSLQNKYKTNQFGFSLLFCLFVLAISKSMLENATEEALDRRGRATIKRGGMQIGTECLRSL